uniref:Serendipity locus protein H-1 n=1 Tax=Cacopsylla melanoneura TaxID=428564 RepID=A0A8D8VPC2_9HEMI
MLVDNMEVADLSDNLCRLCASLFFAKSGFFIFGDDQISIKIQLYIQIQMAQDDCLPKYICSNCLSKIETFHEFAENARTIQHSFEVYNNTSNMYEVEQEENIAQGIEILSKPDSSGLLTKEEQYMHLPSNNFESTFTKASNDNDDYFLSFFHNSSLSSQNLNTKEPSKDPSTMSKMEEENNKTLSNQEPPHTSIIKPIDMKHLTTPSTQPNLFNIPATQPNLFNPVSTPPPQSSLVLDCNYSEDVMNNSYLDISGYPDMCEIEDININYKNSIKFEMGKHVQDEPSQFDISDNSCIRIPSSESPSHDPNDYFSNFEYKLKDAIKYPDFDFIKEMSFNITEERSSNANVTESPLNIDLTNEVQESLCALPSQILHETKSQQLCTPTRNNTSPLPSIFESWNNIVDQLDSNGIEQINATATHASKPVPIYDIIYLGEDIYAGDNVDTKTFESNNIVVDNEQSSVLRSRLLNTEKEENGTEEMTNTTDVNNELITNNQSKDSNYNMSVHTTPPKQSEPSKIPAIQCKSLDKIIKDMQIAQPSIQCKSLDKIIKDMKIANRLSKLKRQSLGNSGNTASSNVQSTSLKLAPKNPDTCSKLQQNEFLVTNTKNKTAYNPKEPAKGVNIERDKSIDDYNINAINEIQVERASEIIEHSRTSVPLTDEPFDINLVRTGVTTYTVVSSNQNNVNYIEYSETPGERNDQTEHLDIEIEPSVSQVSDTVVSVNKSIIDIEKCIAEKIIDMRKPKGKDTQVNDSVKTKNTETDKARGGLEKSEEYGYHIKCNKCTQVLESRTKFDEHYASTHKGRLAYTCVCCNKSTFTFDTFKSHCFRIINRNRYRCDYTNCNKSFSSKTSVVTHIKAVHLKMGPQKYVCEMCGTLFTSKILLDTHLPCNNQDSKVSVCQECGKIFSTGPKLRQHVRRVHSMLTFICDICAKSFNTKHNLAQHIKTHTSNRPHACPHCGKSYFEQSHLRRHMKKHVTSLEYPCSQCPKRFKSDELKRAHEKTHAQCRPLQCEYCTKSFLTQIKLKEHHNTHTGQRPYTCKFCEISFSNYPNWYKHMKRKHPDFTYTSRKVALSGAAQTSSDHEVEVVSNQLVEEIAPHSGLDISSNTIDKEHFQYTTPSDKHNSFEVVLDSGNSNSSYTIYTTGVHMLDSPVYAFHQF